MKKMKDTNKFPYNVALSFIYCLIEEKEISFLAVFLIKTDKIQPGIIILILFSNQYYN